MKLNKIKKVKKEFDPVTHWYSFLSVFSVIFLIIIAYGVYSFAYIKNEIALIGIETVNKAQSEDTALQSYQNKDMMKGIETLNGRLEEFAAKEKTYSALVKTSAVGTSTDVATSTN